MILLENYFVTPMTELGLMRRDLALRKGISGCSIRYSLPCDLRTLPPYAQAIQKTVGIGGGGGDRTSLTPSQELG